MGAIWYEDDPRTLPGSFGGLPAAWPPSKDAVLPAATRALALCTGDPALELAGEDLREVLDLVGDDCLEAAGEAYGEAAGEVLREPKGLEPGREESLLPRSVKLFFAEGDILAKPG